MTGVHGNRLPESYPSAPCDVCRHLYRRATAVHLLGVGGGYPLRSPDGSFVGESRGEYGCWEQDGRLLVGYWVGREFWGRGLATAALAELVTEIPERPLHAWVASSNVGSIRVLEKCGFVEVERHAERDEHSGEVRSSTGSTEIPRLGPRRVHRLSPLSGAQADFPGQGGRRKRLRSRSISEAAASCS